MSYNGPLPQVVNAGGTGQSTLTNHGVLVGAGTSAIAQLAAGSSGQVLQSGVASANPAYSTATYPATATGTGTILRADGTNWSATTATYPTTTTINQLLYSSSANTVGGLATANSSVLTTNSSGVPGWTAQGAAGASLVLIQSQAASSSASINFTTGITSAYNTYLVVLSNVVPATNSTTLGMTYSSNGGSTQITSGYLNGIYKTAYNSATTANGSNTSQAFTTAGIDNTSAVGVSGQIWLYGLTSANYKMAYSSVVYMESSAPFMGTGISTQSTSSAINALQFIMASGNIVSGKFSLFGVLE